MTPAALKDRLILTPVLPGLSLYLAHPGSRLGRLRHTPYWAYAWAGGLVLARHLQAHPATVQGARVVDLGAGSGLVGIAAAQAGAASVLAIDSDRNAGAAMRLNAAANGVRLAIRTSDPLDEPPPPCDILLAGDVFYDAALAERALKFLNRCHGAGITVLIGDPGRSPLPRAALVPVATYNVADMGTTRTNPATVYSVGS